jgi:hypothetical protein
VSLPGSRDQDIDTNKDTDRETDTDTNSDIDMGKLTTGN